MAPNNGLANKKPKVAESDQTKSDTTVLKAGTVEGRGMGTNVNSKEVISTQIQEFLRGEGRFGPKAEFRAFFTVWTFVTRLPGPTWVDHHPGYLMRGMAYFPFNGTLIGFFVSVFFDLANVTMGLPLMMASIVSEGASLWLTGCFHEDGLADSADGIGGGWSRDQILKIMTDTRLGTYGCAVLLLYVIAKLELITILGESVWALGACSGGGPALITTHTLARLTAPLMIKTRDYVDEQGPKYMFYSFFVEAKHLVTWNRVCFATVTSFLVASLAYGTVKAAILSFGIFIVSLFSGRYAEYLLGGVMGDYLGATICIAEVFILTLLLLLSHMDYHTEFLHDFAGFVTMCLSGNSTPQAVINEALNDERIVALLKFATVIIFTTIWCTFVGHPPVFVRKTVTAKGESNDIQVSLVTDCEDCNNHSDEAMSSLQSALLDDEQSFSSLYDSARAYLDTLAKPVGSLGTLEDWAARLAVLQRSSKPTANNIVCLIFAGDHGVAKDKDHGGAKCSAYPQSVTQKVLEGLENNMAGASVLAASNNVEIRVVDVGLAADVKAAEVVIVSKHKINGGTNNFCNEPAMSKTEVEKCILSGREETKRFVKDNKADVLVFGEVGIGNTTTSSALIASLTGEPIESLCDSGATLHRTGGDNSIIANKINIVKEALKYHGAKKMIDKPLLALENVGGAEIAAIAGGIIEASENNIAVLVDGFIVTTAAMIACLISPAACRVLLLATRSTERGQCVAIKAIQDIAKKHGIPALSEPALNMSLRMGEATGGLVAVPILRSATAIFSEMATLEAVLNLKCEKSKNC